MGSNGVRAARAIDEALHDAGNPATALLDWAENRSGVRRTKLFVGLVLVAAVYLTRSGPGPVALGNVVGFAYPAYMTVRMLTRPSGGPEPGPASVTGDGGRRHRHERRHRRAVRWFVYWMVFAAALVAHQLFGRLLGLVPFYGLIRVAVFVWCFAPAPTNGADFVYALLVRRYFAPHFAGRRGRIADG